MWKQLGCEEQEQTPLPLHVQQSSHTCCLTDETMACRGPSGLQHSTGGDCCTRTVTFSQSQTLFDSATVMPHV